MSVDPIVLQIAIAHEAVRTAADNLAANPGDTTMTVRHHLAENERHMLVTKALSQGVPWSDIAEHGFDGLSVA